MERAAARRMDEGDLRALEVGAAILGCGGGGNPYVGRLRAVGALRADHAMEVIPLDRLPDEARVVAVAGVGAPVVSVERIKEGNEGLRALRALEARLGFRADAIACAEIGGANAMEPLILGALAGLPVVDCDGMGRAFPEMQMTTFAIHGHRSTPSAMADPHGDVVVFEHAVSEAAFERMVRACMVAQGGSSTLVLAPMTGAFLRRAAIPGSYAKALALGRAVLDARTARADPVVAACAAEGGRRVFDGTIVDVRREVAGGFVRGEVAIAGTGACEGRRGGIEMQNEFLLFRRDGVVEVAVPDLVVVLDAEEGLPISTEMLRYGQRVAVLALSAHPRLRTPEAMRVVGPRAFGIEGAPGLLYNPDE